MSTASTARSRKTGLSRGSVRLAFFAAVAAIPLLSLGITVPAAIAVRGANVDLDAGEAQLVERQALVARLLPYANGVRPDELEQLARQLFDLIPVRLQPLDEFGEVRAVVAARGVELESLRRTQTHPTGLVRTLSDGRSFAVVADEIVIALDCSLEATFALADDLRADGLPTVVLGFDVARANLTETSFQTELRLGFLRRVPFTAQAAE